MAKAFKHIREDVYKAQRKKIEGLERYTTLTEIILVSFPCTVSAHRQGTSVLLGSIFECVSIPKVPSKFLEHTTACKNVFSSPLSDFQQPGVTQNQNSRHTGNFEGHGGPTGSKVRSGSNFEYVDISKLPGMLLEHGSAWANAFPNPLIDLQQPGVTQNQNSHHTSNCEGHGGPTSITLITVVNKTKKSTNHGFRRDECPFLPERMMQLCFPPSLIYVLT